MASFSKTFDFNLRREHQKNFLWASRLWVGRRKEPILGYVSKNDEKKNSGGKGLIRKENLMIHHLNISFGKKKFNDTPFTYLIRKENLMIHQ